MSYHNGNSSSSSSSSQSSSSPARTPAPPGYHYMPDGTLMSDVEHEAIFLSEPTIESTTGLAISTNTGAPYIGRCYNTQTYVTCANNVAHNTLDRLYQDQTEDHYQAQFGLTTGPPNYTVITAPVPVISSYWNGAGGVPGALPPVLWNTLVTNFLFDQLSWWNAVASMSQFQPIGYNGSLGMPYRNGCSSLKGHREGWSVNSSAVPFTTNYTLEQSQVPGNVPANTGSLGNTFPITSAQGGSNFHYKWWEYQMKINWTLEMEECCACNETSPDSGIQAKTTQASVPIKYIEKFDLDLSDLPATSESRRFTIAGDEGAEFKLEIKDKDTGAYYNFITNVFQAEASSLEEQISGGSYNGSITFPAVTGGDDQYDIYMYAKPGTEHAAYNEVRFGDGSIDINNSTGSNSLMMQKVIYQYEALTLTLAGYSIGGTISGTNGVDTISINRGKPQAKTAFSFTFTAAATAAYRILKQPVESDILAFIEPVVGSAPIDLPGENIYPAINNTDTVNGAVTSGTTVTMDSAVATKMVVGDRVTGNAALNATTATVVSLDSTNAFTLSEAIAISDGVTLSFSNRMNFSWPINNYANLLKEGMILVPGTNVTADTSIGSYKDTVTLFEGTKEKKEIIKSIRPALSTLAKKPTVVKGLVTVQEGQVVFDKQQVLALAGVSLRVGGYGEGEILRVYGWEVKFTDLAIALTPPTTTTTETSAGGSSADIAVTSKEGVINNVSRVSGIGINPALQNPLITAGGGATGGGDWTMDAVQTLENGITLTVENTGRVATITGNIEIVKAGTASQTLRFDVNRLLSTSA